MSHLSYRGIRVAGCLLAALLAGNFCAAQDDAAAARHAGVQAVYPIMLKALEAGDFAQARLLCEHAITMEPRDPTHRYNLACIEARAGGPMLARALAALEQAIQLGFNDRNSIESDPDLATIRSDPKFAELVRTVAARSKTDATKQPATPPAQASAKTAAPAPASAPAAKRPAANAAASATKAEKPAAAVLKDGVPVGLYFMTRFWSFTGTLEKLVWYFAPDGTVYQSLEHGFSKADLAAHAGLKGRCAAKADALEVTWADGKKTSSGLERSETGFSWDGGIFTPVKAFTPDIPLAGTYEGGESISFSGNRAAVSKTLELRPDGTFRWNGVSFISSTTDASRVTAGASGEGSTGRWHASDYSLVLVDAQGTELRRIAFPYDDEKTPVQPDWIFFGGTMYKKR